MDMMEKGTAYFADTTGSVEKRSVPTMAAPGMEQLFFEMEDRDHVFCVGLTTLLECMLFAAKEGAIPELPLSWYTAVCDRYDIPLSVLFGTGSENNVEGEQTE
jgi:hypothetical protein